MTELDKAICMLPFVVDVVKASIQETKAEDEAKQSYNQGLILHTSVG